jgi:hypothetical protein
MFVIELTSGKAKNVSGLSMFPAEDEVLIPPYTTFGISSGKPS